MPKEYLYRVTDRRPGAALPVRFVIGHRQEQALNFVSRSTFDVELCDGLAGAQAVIDGHVIERAVQAETSPTAALPLEPNSSEEAGSSFTGTTGVLNGPKFHVGPFPEGVAAEWCGGSPTADPESEEIRHQFSAMERGELQPSAKQP